MEYCDECLNLNSCGRCKEGIDYNYNRCININIDNCQVDDSQGICKKCNNNYAFNGTNNNFCIEKEKFKDNFYYTKDNGTSYFFCGNEINNCEKCEYNIVDDNIKCNLCNDGYIIYENKCILKSEVDENKTYFYIDNNNVKKCSDVIPNCQQCNNENTCDKCMKGNYFLNNDKTICIPKNEIKPIKEYFFNIENSTYLSCERFNLFENCKECSNYYDCDRCKPGYKYIEYTCINNHHYVKFLNLFYLLIINLILI